MTGSHPNILYQCRHLEEDVISGRLLLRLIKNMWPAPAGGVSGVTDGRKVTGERHW